MDFTYLMLLPPSTYLRLIDIPNFKEFDLSSVKLVQMSAGGTSSEIILKTYEAFPNCEINYGWGQTESGAGKSCSHARNGTQHIPGVQPPTSDSLRG